MPTYTHDHVVVYNELAGTLRVARSTRAFVTDTVTGLPVDVTQGARTAAYVDTDTSGRATFTATVPSRLRMTSGATFVDVWPIEVAGPDDATVAGLLGTASATQTAADARYAQSAALAAKLDVTAAAATYVRFVTGLVPGNSSTPVKAANAAILAAAMTPGASVIIPGPGLTYYTNPVTVVGPVNIAGADITTTLINDTGTVFILSGTQINVSTLYIRSGGGGHVITQSGAVDQCHWDKVKMTQAAPGYSVWDNAGFGFVDMRFSNFLSWHIQTATVPTWNLVAVGGAINANVWSQFRAQFSGNYHFWVETTDVNSQFSNVWRDATWEVTTGGMIKLVGVRDYIVDNSTVWDLGSGAGGVTTLTKNGIYADTNGSNALCVGTIRNHRRLDSTPDAGIYDIKLPSGTARGAGTILERCQNIASANPLAIDLAGNAALVINPGSSASTLTTYANATAAQFIGPTGITLPTTQAFMVGTLAAGMGLKGSQSITASAIAAGGEGTFTITVTGALVGDSCSVSTRSILDAGLAITSWAVTAPDTVTVRLRNLTAGSITPTARTWDARVWR